MIDPTSEVFRRRLQELLAAKAGTGKLGVSPWGDEEQGLIDEIGRTMVSGGGTGMNMAYDPELIFMRRLARLGPEEIRSGHAEQNRGVLPGSWEALQDALSQLSGYKREREEALRY